MGGEDLPTPERQQSYGPTERLRATQAALSSPSLPLPPYLRVMHSPLRERLGLSGAEGGQGGEDQQPTLQLRRSGAGG